MKFIILYTLLAIGLEVKGENEFRMLVKTDKDSIQFGIDDVHFDTDSHRMVFIHVLDSSKANRLYEFVFDDNIFFDSINSNCFGGIIEIYYLNQKQLSICLMDFYASNMPIHDYALTLSNHLMSRGGFKLKQGQISLNGLDSGYIWRNGFREYLLSLGKLNVIH